MPPLLARMPSMRPQPTAPARVEPRQRLSKPATVPAPEATPDEPALSEEERRARGGFHESSYELRTGMDMTETEWPDDTTLPGALDDGDDEP